MTTDRSSKSGRRISAATRAKLEEAREHCKATIEHGNKAIACLEKVLASDDEDAAKALAQSWGVAEFRLLN